MTWLQTPLALCSTRALAVPAALVGALCCSTHCPSVSSTPSSSGLLDTQQDPGHPRLRACPLSHILGPVECYSLGCPGTHGAGLGQLCLLTVRLSHCWVLCIQLGLCWTQLGLCWPPLPGTAITQNNHLGLVWAASPQGFADEGSALGLGRIVSTIHGGTRMLWEHWPRWLGPPWELWEYRPRDCQGRVPALGCSRHSPNHNLSPQPLPQQHSPVLHNFSLSSGPPSHPRHLDRLLLLPQTPAGRVMGAGEAPVLDAHLCVCLWTVPALPRLSLRTGQLLSSQTRGRHRCHVVLALPAPNLPGVSM